MICPKCGNESEGMFCNQCGASMTGEESAPQSNTKGKKAKAPKEKKPIHKKWWFWVIIIFLGIGIISSLGGGDETGSSNDTGSGNKVIVADFSAMSKEEISSWCEEHKVTCEFNDDYSDSVEKGKFVSQSKVENETIKEGGKITVVFSKGPKPSVEYLNALTKAEIYSSTMFMSKKGIYEQLTSPYGEKFPADAAQYAVDNLDADFKQNALEKAKTYQETMSMSKSAIYDQLVSSYGEKFTPEEAQYAIDNLE